MNFDPHLFRNFTEASKRRSPLDQLDAEIARIKSKAAYAEKLAKIQERLDEK